jgi:hypothetical protein
VKALKVCARPERESEDCQNKYSHHLGVRAERSLLRLSGLNHHQIDACSNFAAGMHDVKDLLGSVVEEPTANSENACVQSIHVGCLKVFRSHSTKKGDCLRLFPAQFRAGKFFDLCNPFLYLVASLL